MARLRRTVCATACLACLCVVLPSPARAAQVSQDVRFTASDGVELLVRVGGDGPLQPRPVIVEFSPYGPACCRAYAGPDYNTDPVTGDIVQPYGRFDAKRPASPGEERLYRIEFWPIGNRFKAGHRVRLHVVGVSAYHVQHGLGVNTIRQGGAAGSRLLFPVLPGSDLASALE